MSKGTVLLVSYHFYPSPEVGAKRPSETALHLARLGYEVTVLRAVERKHLGAPQPERLRALDIVSVTVPRRMFTAAWIRLKRFIPRPRLGANDSAELEQSNGAGADSRLSVFGWLRRQLLAVDTLFQGDKRWLCISVAKVLFHSRKQKFDLVIASGPPMVSYLGGWTIACLTGSKLILDYRDPWYLHSDDELSTIVSGHPLANFENSLANRCAKRCVALVAASPGTKRHILERFDVLDERVHVVRNGFDEHARIDDTTPHGKLEILYTGSLYWNRDPFLFLEALHQLLVENRLDRNKVRLRLVGKCEEWQGIPLGPWIEAHDLQDTVEILPFMPPDELRTLVAGSNVLVNFAQGQPRQIPAKSYDYIASGREVLVIAESDSDVANLFREAGVGYIIEPGDADEVKEAIKELYGIFVTAGDSGAPKQVSVEPYSRAAQLEKFSAIVADTMAESMPPSRN